MKNRYDSLDQDKTPTLTARRPSRPGLAAMLAIGGTALALAACSPSPGDRGGQAGGQAGMPAQTDRGMDGARTGTAGTTGTPGVVDAARDTTITAAVRAQLMSDDMLRNMDISVTTERGQVTLEGNAPSADARERATNLASSVDGVNNVNNRLMVVAMR
jgi:hyperosmotically inducible periplasmic protein